MSIQTQLILYADNGYYSHQIRLALAHKNLTYQLRLYLYDRPEDLADLNPYNSLPVLIDKDLILYENRVILDYLDERFVNHKLLPDNPIERAKIRQYAWRISNDWLKLADVLLTHTDSFNAVQAQLAQDKLNQSLISIAPLFAHQPYFLADKFGLCDCLLAPMLWRLEEMHIELPRHLCRPLLNYCDRLFNSDAFIASTTD